MESQNMIAAFAIGFMVVVLVGWLLMKRTEAYEKDPIDPMCRNVDPVQLLQVYKGNLNALAKDVTEQKLPIQMVESPSEYPRIASVLKRAGKIRCDGTTITRIV